MIWICFGNTKVLAATDQFEIEAEGSVNFDTNTNITTATKNVKITNNQGVILADQVIYDANQGKIVATGKVKAVYNDGTNIKAAELHYDSNNELADFSGGVDLVLNNFQTHSDKLVYHGMSGDVLATGDVKIYQKQSVFQSETFKYNLNDEKGETGLIEGEINQKIKDLKISGKNSTIERNETQFNKVILTTCPKPKPDFTISATRIKHDGKWVKLWNPVLFIKGFPVFYFPYLVVPADGSDYPTFDVGYSESDGYKITTNYTTPVEGGRNWSIKSTVYTNNTSSIGVGMGAFYGNISNYSNVYYYFYNDNISNYFSVNDQLYFKFPLFVLKIDGEYDINSTQKQQYGIALTRKYWNTSLGDWQFGILARNVFAYDSSKKEYGGTYGGYRLDYKPNRYMTFSLLRLYPLTKNERYGDFLEDNPLGSNWIYNMEFPLNQIYSLHVEGNYNSDENYWAHRIFSVTRETCCFKMNIGWDFAKESLVWSGSIKF